MLGLGNSFDQVTHTTAMSTSGKEEKFDYTDDEFDENDDNALSPGKSSGDKKFSFSSFLNQMNGKQKALAIAHQLDAKKGMFQDDTNIEKHLGNDANPQDQKEDVPKTKDENYSKTMLRRVPSGARPAANGPSLGTSTPMKSGPQSSNSSGHTINDLLVQSTPLSTSKPSSSQLSAQPKDILKEKLIGNHNKNSGNMPSRDLSQETKDLIDEISKLKEELASYEQLHLKKDDEICSLNHALREKDTDIQTLQKTLDSRHSTIQKLENKIREKQDLVELTQTEKSSVAGRYQAEIEELQRQLKKIKEKNEEIDQLKHQLHESAEHLKVAEEKNIEVDQLRNQLKELVNEVEMHKAKYNQVTAEYEKSLEDKKANLERSETLVKQLKMQNEKALEEKEQDKETIDSLKEKVLDQNRRLDSLELQYTESSNDGKNQISLLEEKNKGLETENANIHGELKDLRNDLKKTQDRNIALDQECAKFKTSNAKLTHIVEMLKENSELQKGEISKLEKEIEEKWKKQGENLSHLKTEHLGLKKKYEQAKEQLSTANTQLQASEVKLSELNLFLQHVELFGVQIGQAIGETYKKNKDAKSIETQILKDQHQVIGFYTQNQKDMSISLDRRLKETVAECDHMRKQIEQEWKVKVSKLEDLVKESDLKFQALEEQLKKRDLKIERLSNEVDDLQSEKLALIREKEQSLKNTIKLGDQISKLREEFLIKEKEIFMDLSDKIEQLSSQCTSLRTDLESAENQVRSSEFLVREKDEILREKSNKMEELESIISQLRTSLEVIRGDPSRMISFETIEKSRPHITRKTYDALLVDKVNDVDNVELQNIVKNIILLLGIPLSKLTKKMPLVAIYLQYEKSLCLHFANQLHYTMFNETIDIKRFTNQAYQQYLDHRDLSHIEHPLGKCLENLYKEIISRL